VTVSSGLSGRWASTGVEDVLGRAGVRYYNRDGEQRLFVVGLSGSFAVHPDADHQILLGGDNGLRGYPLRYATGDRALLLTVEQRFFYDRELFHLIRLGAAVYADVGKARSEAPELASHLGVLKDVGIGLRIGQTRSAHANVVRIDLAMPLDDLTGRLRPQILISTGETF
jgi:outer membrane translocation and assembly module TamA